MNENHDPDPVFLTEPQVQWINSGRAWYGTLGLAAALTVTVYGIIPSTFVSAVASLGRTSTFLAIAFLFLTVGLLLLLSPTAEHSSVNFRASERFAPVRAAFSGVGIAWILVTVVDVNAFSAFPTLPSWAHLLLHLVGLVPPLTVWDPVQRQILATWYLFARTFSL